MISHPTPSLAVSSCLLGQNVRYDGQNKLVPSIAEKLPNFFTLIPVCPEVEVGLGVPREPIQRELESGKVRLRTVQSKKDLTEQMESFAAAKITELQQKKISGYILKSKSPSCGLVGVKLFSGEGEPRAEGSGVFTAALSTRWPFLPKVEETQLFEQREHFFTCAFFYHRLQELFSKSWALSELIEFHSQHKLLLMAYSIEAYQALGRLVSMVASIERGMFSEAYQRTFLEAFQTPTTTGRHVNALSHAAGYFRGVLSSSEREQIQDAIEGFSTGALPLEAPRRLLLECAARANLSYLTSQYYLSPYPEALSAL